MSVLGNQKGIIHLINSSKRSGGTPPVQDENTGLVRDGGNPQQLGVPKQEIQPPDTLVELFLSQGMIPNPTQPAVERGRHRVLCMRGQAVPLGLGNGDAEDSVQGLQHVEDRDHVIGRHSLYASGPREQVREEGDRVHVGVRHGLVQERELEVDWRSRASRQRRLLGRGTGTPGKPPSPAGFLGNGIRQLGRGHGDIEVQRRGPTVVRYRGMNLLNQTVSCKRRQRDIAGAGRAGGGW